MHHHLTMTEVVVGVPLLRLEVFEVEALSRDTRYFPKVEDLKMFLKEGKKI